ncbi:EamA family transporter [Streptomyces sp. NPDC059255]|uniref:EamA family transporter n=1 Tax=Streptomyces sp. NPDC059255 TaxID=3346793 RepID=UPI0036B53E1D
MERAAEHREGTADAQRGMAGVRLGLAGVAVLSAGLGRGGLTGAAILLPAAMCWVLGSHLDDHSAGVRGPAAQMIVGGAALAVAAAARGEFASPPRPHWGAGLALAYLVVFGSLLAMAAYRHLTAHTNPAPATSYAFVAPVIAVLSGALFLDEPLTSHILAGTALIAVALSTTLLTGARPAAGPTTTAPGHPEAVRRRRSPASSRCPPPPRVPTPRAGCGRRREGCRPVCGVRTRHDEPVGMPGAYSVKCQLRLNLFHGTDSALADC